MTSNLSDVYAAFAKLSKFDKRFQTKKACKAVEMFTKYLNDSIFFTDVQLLTSKAFSYYFTDTELDRINIEDICAQTYEDFRLKADLVKRRIFRSIVNMAVDHCETSDCELIDIHRDLNDIYDKSAVRNTEKANSIRTEITGKSTGPIVVFGDSSSGKTVSVAQAIDRIVTSGQASYTWIDLSDVNIEVEHFVYTVARATKRSTHIIVVDNVQSHPSKVLWLIKAVAFFEQYYSDIQFRIVNICWRSARKTVINYYNPEKTVQIACSGDDTIVELIRSYSLDKYEKEIISNSSGDVLIAYSTIEFLLSNGTFPSEKQLAFDLFKKKTGDYDISGNASKVLYTVASLGEFEIHVRADFLNSISKEGFEELLEHNILRTYKTENDIIYVAIGHRSLAHKILGYLKTIVPNAKSPIDLAIEYLTIDGENQILSTLERLDLELETNDSMMAKLWQAYCNMRDSVYKQVSIDPTWGNNMASMIFATEALANIMSGEENKLFLKRTRDEIYKRWKPALDFSGIEFVGKNNGIDQTTEIIDFIDNIKRTMFADEKDNQYEERMQSTVIDYYKFHDNWLLGLLLGFEGILKNDGQYKEAYIRCAEMMQQPNGSFYPERVCWVTARVIMGLCECGMSYTNPVVKRACNWLVEQLVERDIIRWAVDDLNCGGWRSGTGTWNSDEQITLMCICALFKAQYPIRKNEKVSSILFEFWRCRKPLEDLFVSKGTVLDIVWIIDAMLLDNRNPIDLQEEIKDLTDYVLNTWNNASLLSSEKETESSDVSFMAKELLSIVWALLNKNIALLLKGLELDYSLTRSQKDIFISYRREEGGGSAFAQSLYIKLDAIYKGNVFLDVYDLSDESNDFDTIIEKAVRDSKVVIAIASDHCFDRACVEGYDNEEDVFYNELKTALELNKNIIAIYNSSSKRSECPERLKVNPDFYRVAKLLAKKNASFYDATIPNAIIKLSEEVVKKINHINI